MSDDASRAALPFGSWPSPVSAELIGGATIRLGELALRGTDIFWSEGRPQEQGRNVLVRCAADGSLADVTPAPFNVRTRAHEYGGGAFAVWDEGVVFSHDDDQQLHRIRAGGAPEALTRDPDQRYADTIVDRARDRLIAVREDHRRGDLDAVASLVAIALDGGAVSVLAQGHDFYSSPALKPGGAQLAWLAWNHPNMPWDGSELWLAGIADDGGLSAPRRIAGGPNESIFQPAWSPRGELHFVSDRSGWWNLYRVRSDDGAIEALHPMAAEFGEPQWVFGMSSYGFDASGRIVCIVRHGGSAQLARIDPQADAPGRFQILDTPFCALSSLRVGADCAVFVGATRTAPDAVVKLDLTTLAHEVLRTSSGAAPLADADIAIAEPITFPTANGFEAHGYFYAPANRAHHGPPGARPPLLVIGHGGPTAATSPAFKWSIQYWTSRGFAIVDVDYGGSSGYGRAYRERLDGRWGVVDVDDSIAAARYLVARGDVDADRIAIRGASAGGYTTLCALTFRSFFKAGASHYGIGDLEALARDTHKFESRYLDRLIGPYPQAQALYRERSPIHHTDRLATPMILFQGREDKAVPPSQAQAMFAAVDGKGLPVALLMFDGEQHGFRRGATIRRVLEAELYFYSHVFGFTPTDTIEPVEIRNLPPVRR